MASQAYTNTPKVRLIMDGQTIYLDPLDDDARVAIEAWFAAYSLSDTVTATKEAANRGGYGQDGPYNVLKLAITTA